MPETNKPMPGMVMDGSENKAYMDEKMDEHEEHRQVNDIKPHMNDKTNKYSGGFNAKV
jgi:hypothetical protein